MSTDSTSKTLIVDVKNYLKWASMNVDILNDLCSKILARNVDLSEVTNLLINITYSIILDEIYTK